MLVFAFWGQGGATRCTSRCSCIALPAEQCRSRAGRGVREPRSVLAHIALLLSSAAHEPCCCAVCASHARCCQAAHEPCCCAACASHARCSRIYIVLLLSSTGAARCVNSEPRSVLAQIALLPSSARATLASNSLSETALTRSHRRVGPRHRRSHPTGCYTRSCSASAPCVARVYAQAALGVRYVSTRAAALTKSQILIVEGN